MIAIYGNYLNTKNKRKKNKKKIKNMKYNTIWENAKLSI